jgi:hypothetical protein
MLTRKLHLGPGMRFVALNAPDGFKDLLGELPDGAREASTLGGLFDLIVLFATDQKTLATRWPKILASLKDEGILWLAFPKKASGVKSNLGGMNSGEISKGSAWQPVASISIDETWSAVRFKHSPGLEERRARRGEEISYDADGTPCIDRKNRVITPPADLRQLLKRHEKARTFFESLSFTNRREYVEWIIGAKRADTRSQRLTLTLDKLSDGKRNPSER